MREARFLYKCRKCGKICEKTTLPEKLADQALLNAEACATFSGTRPTMLDIHRCNENSMGILDLIGYETYEES